MPIDVKKANLHPTHKCSFCGKNNNEVAMIIAGDGVCICDECVFECVTLVFSNNRRLRREHDANGESHAN